MGHLPCEECRRAYAITKWDTPAEREHKKAGPPCAACRPEVHPYNAEASSLYMRCAGQLIVGPMGAPLDINVLAVKCIMDLEGTANQAEVMQQVQHIAGIVLHEQAKERERRAEDKQRER
ncbi:MAG: hypothetical protein AB7V08_14415 [Elusimicrobiales bacterium]